MDVIFGGGQNEERKIVDTTFRPIHYLGNKTRVLDHIERSVDALSTDGSLVCDLFSGTGVVARRLAKSHDVLAGDVQEYSRVLTSAQLTRKVLPTSVAAELCLQATERYHQIQSDFSPILDEERHVIERAAFLDGEDLALTIEASSLAVKEQSNSLSERDLLLWRTLPNDAHLSRLYGGLYYSMKQSLELDAIASVVRHVNSDYRDIAMAALLSAASETVSSVGNHFAQPAQVRSRDGQIKHATVRRVAKQRTRSVLRSYKYWIYKYTDLPTVSGKGTAIRTDYRALLRNIDRPVGVIYADPPYTRDHYSRFYHVLETIAREDYPELGSLGPSKFGNVSRAAYRADRHQSPFCIPSKVESAFEQMFLEAKRLDASMVISYSPSGAGTAMRPNPRLMTVPKLVELTSKFFADVRVEVIQDIAHSKFNSKQLNGPVDREAEVLILARG